MADHLMPPRYLLEKATVETEDIRKFHDAVLDQGPLPLDVLDQQITAWIATQKRD